MPVENVTNVPVPVRRALPVNAAPQPVAAQCGDTLTLSSRGLEAKVQAVDGRLKAAMAVYDAFRAREPRTGWRELARLNTDALKDARAKIAGDPELARRCEVTAQVIDSWLSNYGTTTEVARYAPGEWLRFADSSRLMLDSVSRSLAIGR